MNDVKKDFTIKLDSKALIHVLNLQEKTGLTMHQLLGYGLGVVQRIYEYKKDGWKIGFIKEVDGENVFQGMEVPF